MSNVLARSTELPQREQYRLCSLLEQMAERLPLRGLGSIGAAALIAAIEAAELADVQSLRSRWDADARHVPDVDVGLTWDYLAPAAASRMTAATSSGLDNIRTWLAAISVVFALMALDMARCASGAIIPSSLATTYQLGFFS